MSKFIIKDRDELRKKIYGQLKNTFNAHPEYISENVDINLVCSSATKRIFGDIKNIIPEDDSSYSLKGEFIE